MQSRQSDDKKQKSASLLNNSRFYILATSFLLSVVVAAYLRLDIPADQLYYIRLEQIFSLVCIFYWYGALVISPVGYVIGKQRMKRIEFARRAIGVSAAYFALLHAGVALWGQLGGLGEISQLPDAFKWSLLGGVVALGILLVMAATSFDKVVAFMTFKRWKWLHRLVYIGGIVALLHIWSIGTHATYSGVQWAAFIALVVLSGLEMFRVVTLLTRKYPAFQGKDYFYALFITFWAFWVVAITWMPAVVQNYHSVHHTHGGSQGAGHE